MNTPGSLRLRLVRISYEAERVCSFEFEDVYGGLLPPATPGAHVDISLPSGLSRSYSLVGTGAALRRYVVAVHHAPNSRGGSALMHETLRVGTILDVGRPRNNFPLVEDAPHSVLIAGGIGVTPLLSMVDRLIALGRSFELHYSARTEDSAAYRRRLLDLDRDDQVHFHFDGGSPADFLDIGAICSAAPADAHLYCCGPTSMLESFTLATADRPESQVHLEHFSPAESAATDGGYVVALGRSGREFQIAPGTSILDTLLDDGLDLSYSCSEGTCGSCEVRVLEGIPDHRDSVLTPEERRANDRMMICCSGSKSGRIVLDL